MRPESSIDAADVGDMYCSSTLCAVGVVVPVGETSSGGAVSSGGVLSGDEKPAVPLVSAVWQIGYGKKLAELWVCASLWRPRGSEY